MSLEDAIRETVASEVRAALRPLQEQLEHLGKELARRPVPGDYVTVEQAAALLQVNHKTVRGWLSAGRLTPHGDGRILRVAVSELLALRPADPSRSSEDHADAELAARIRLSLSA